MQFDNLKRAGYQVVQMTPYQYRVECVVDLYPVRCRYHNIADGTRGEYPQSFKKLRALIDSEVAKADAILDKHLASENDTDSTGRYLTEQKKPWWAKIVSP